MTAVDAVGLTPFLAAAQHGHAGTVTKLLSWSGPRKKNVDVLSQAVTGQSAQTGKNALFLAVENNHTHVLHVRY